ncbi:acyl-CoA dehydrogenase family protein [Acinetobacter sp. ANC 3813]|uniref:acyl-CoA dehydrogenase family protein n=1 Tax=Acinetobacter sp. ANC 3813 TaxID=1977873 RepID=UPI000B65C522|nr:acyl-CoA dehydrogenase family protein [Acinetobacter sp. ANC 3813]OTG91329.1 hypothetical protein B9T34_03210 [Acinetobacter sp. ANC 3813]
MTQIRQRIFQATEDFVPEIAAQRQRGLEMRERVAKILPIIAANAEKTEQERKVPDENIKLLIECGFTRSLQPAVYGGYELSPEEYCPIITDIAGACASTAWVSGLLAQHNHGLALMSKQVQDEVWGEDPTTLISSSVAPIHQAENVEGGIKISGRFSFSSGCDHGQWAVLGIKRYDIHIGMEDSPCFILVPRKDYEIFDDWHVAGLCGTGSKTIVLKDVFVPEYRIESIFAMNFGQSSGYGLHDGGIFKAPFMTYFSFGFSAVAIGIAMRALDVYQARLAGRVRAYTGTKVSDNAPSYMRLAESAHQVRAAYQSLATDWKEIASRSRSGEIPESDESGLWRTNQAYVTKMAIEAVSRLLEASGGGAWQTSNEMQRLWRDANAAGSHAYSDYDVAAQLFGRQLLELDLAEGLI